MTMATSCGSAAAATPTAIAATPPLPHGRVAFDQLVDSTIARPARYLGNERGVLPRDWDSAGARWCLTYPDLYEVGASNLGHIILYSILNAIPGQLCDRAYLPAPDLAERLRQQGQPLFAVESRRALAVFDILGFSLSYELGATNILEMLDLAGLPLRAADRGDLPLNDPAAPPLIFAGGPTATSNPEPFAAFFDFFALGDGEELLAEIGLVVAEAKADGLSRSALLADLAHVPGVYVPALYAPGPDGVTLQPLRPELPARVLRRVATPMPHYGMGLVPHIETVHDRLTIEIRRGCTRGCRFCQPGMLTRPARDVEPEAVIEAVEEGMARTGYSDFSLLSLSCSDYLALPAVGVELRNRLSEHNVSLTLPSQRVDRFDQNIAHILGGTRKAGLTFAPEAGTQRLRDIVNKGLTDAELLRGIRTAMENGYRKVKLYFMIGLPGETDADVIGIADTCRALQQQCRDLGRLELNLTISNFTPKPHTPFQWHSVSTAEFRRRQELLRRELRTLKGIKCNVTDPRLSAMEDFIGRGDRRLAPVLEAAWRAGAGMDAWFETIDRTHAAWTGAIEAEGLGGRYRALELGDWTATGALSGADLEAFCAQPLPWDHVDSGVDKRWLAEDLQRALAAVVVPDCSFEGCSSCGVCGPEFGHNVVVAPPPIPAAQPPRSPASERIQRLRFGFGKRGSLALLSHLDLARLLERALRRSQLPVSFSGGFHPLPRLQFALALPLGVEAEGEWLDLEFAQVCPPEEVLARLQAQLPQGFSLHSVQEVPLAGPALSQQLAEAHWSLQLLPEVAAGAEPVMAPSTDDWHRAIEHLLQSATLPWRDSDKKGRPRERDCRPCLIALELLPAPQGADKTSRVITNAAQAAAPASAEAAAAGAATGEGTAAASVTLRLQASIDAQGRSIRPDQVRQWLVEALGQPLRLGPCRRDRLILAPPA